MKRLLTLESIPWIFRQLEFRIFMKRFEKWRANFFVRFLTIVGLSKAATLTILAVVLGPSPTEVKR